MPQLIRYLISGVFCAALEFSTFQLAHHFLDFNLVVANTIAFGLAFISNFFITKFFVFNHSQRASVRYQFIAYCLLVAINYALSTWLLVYLVKSWHLQATVSKFLSMVAVAAWNFFIFKKVVYR